MQQLWNEQRGDDMLSEQLQQTMTEKYRREMMTSVRK